MEAMFSVDVRRVAQLDGYTIFVWVFAVVLVVLMALVVWGACRTAKKSIRCKKRCCSSSSGSSTVNSLSFEVDPDVLATIQLDTGFSSADRKEEDDVSTQQPSVTMTQRSCVARTFAISGIKTISTSVPEAEESVAASPASASGLKWIAAVSDFSIRGGFNTTKYAYSLDGGNSWSGHFVPLNSSTSKPQTADGLQWDANSDPVCAFSPSGNIAYCASLYFNVSNNANGIYIAAAVLPSTLGPAMYTVSQVRRVVANTSPTTPIFDDKEWIATDPTSGAVYCSWTRFTATSDSILFSRSTNQAVTWSAPIQVSPSSLNGAVQGSSVAADGNGAVWVLWTTFYTQGVRRLFASRSTNGGVSFATIGISISPFFNGLTFPSLYRKEAFAAMAIEKGNRTVHVVYPATSSNSTSKILYIKALSTSNSFTSPVNLINTTAGNQFFPAIGNDFANTGLIQVSWFDTRNSTGTQNSQIDIYTSRSTNAGATFASSNQRVTPTKTNVGNTTFVGDYCGVAVQGKRALPVFAFLVTPLQTAIIT